MSSLIFYTDPEQVLVVTDTLAVNPDGSPLHFTSKAHYLPHLRTIVAGTGLDGFSVEWAMTANNRMIVRGVEHLNHHASKGLRDLWTKYQRDYQPPADLTTTVYHFGISEESGAVAAFAYRSTNNFTSERIAQGPGAKPECTIPEGDLDVLLEHLESMMNEQRRLQEAKPPPERLHIGGEAHAIHLTKAACTFVCLFRFSDFKAQERQILCPDAQG